MHLLAAANHTPCAVAAGFSRKGGRQGLTTARLLLLPLVHVKLSLHSVQYLKLILGELLIIQGCCVAMPGTPLCILCYMLRASLDDRSCHFCLFAHLS